MNIELSELLEEIAKRNPTIVEAVSSMYTTIFEGADTVMPGPELGTAEQMIPGAEHPQMSSKDTTDILKRVTNNQQDAVPGDKIIGLSDKMGIEQDTNGLSKRDTQNLDSAIASVAADALDFSLPKEDPSLSKAIHTDVSDDDSLLPPDDSLLPPSDDMLQSDGVPLDELENDLIDQL
ncbi:MAG: hypothetical protein MJZ25_03645 [Fibrobacter sp.]|nr:hypothetical protein [Fibrobacter sp.]